MNSRFEMLSETSEYALYNKLQEFIERNPKYTLKAVTATRHGFLERYTAWLEIE